jgi:DNA ligase-associated metallophosphoesterase
MSDGDLEIVLRGESLTLLPERAMYWRAKETLFIADPHWGKAATFRAHGIPVPSGTTDEGIARLDRVVQRTSTRHVIFLGDLLHAKAGRSTEMFAALGEWRRNNAEVDLLLVRGNHDRRAGDPPQELGIRCTDAPFLMSPFVLDHHPRASDDGYVLAGHVHPGVRVYGAGRQMEKLPCFWFGAAVGILPAFGDFTGLAIVEPEERDSVYAIADQTVIRIVQKS